jgi:hypothetical protein
MYMLRCMCYIYMGEGTIEGTGACAVGLGQGSGPRVVGFLSMGGCIDIWTIDEDIREKMKGQESGK